MKYSNYQRARHFLLGALLSIVVTCDAPFCFGVEVTGPPLPSTKQVPGPQSVRSGGKLEQSYNYHRQSAAQPTPVPTTAGSARSGGWYRYGFPVESYRWGYFGAERNYPRVTWHTGWYGDCVKTEIWHGY